MEESGSRKRRSRTSNSPDGDDRRRGRPRVEKPDESAADRRRTQIRMAQRAYRQRKESTLEELRKRVSDLSNTVEVMNKIFMDCRDRLYASNIGQNVMMDLSNVSMQFEELVKDARNPDDENVSEQPNAVHRLSNASKNVEASHDATTVEPKNVSSWLDAAVLAKHSKSTFHAPMGYTLYNENNGSSEEEVQQPMEMVSFNVDASDATAAPNSGLQGSLNANSFDILHADIPNAFVIPHAPSPPMTYSFQESTFARRLHRACAEMAYRHLLDPNRKPAEFERIFRLSSMGRDRAKLTRAIKSVLDRGPHEELDFWESPLIHVGGAGTHYARRDPFGNLLPKSTSHNLGIIGPQTLALLENAARDNLSTDMTVELAGFEGEWFDPYDVQGYLEEKGIFIDPTSSFAEAELIEYPGGGAGDGSTPSSNHPATPAGAINGRTTPLTTSQVNTMIHELDVDFSKWDDSKNLSVGYSDAQFGSWMNFLEPGANPVRANANANANSNNNIPVLPAASPAVMDWEAYQLENMFQTSGTVPPTPEQQQHQPKRKKILIDVSKLVKVMVVSGVCLGRTPGFRRRDVDRALAISSFDAF